MILIRFAFLFHTQLTSKLRLLTMYSRHFLLTILEVSRFLKDEITSSMNAIFCSLFYRIESFKVLMISSTMGMVMDKGAWLDVSRHSG